jgi:hypothetical protein
MNASMGLHLTVARFAARPPPTEEAFRAELLRQVGSLRDLDTFTVGDENSLTKDDQVVEVLTTLEPVTTSYVRKLLRDLGGEELDARGATRPLAALPWFVSRPWTAWPWWRRAGVRVGVIAAFWGAVLGGLAGARRGRRAPDWCCDRSMLLTLRQAQGERKSLRSW